MSGSIPNILIILLAIVTYGSLAFVIMRFALRESRGPDADDAAARTRGGAPGVEPAVSAWASRDRRAP